MVGFRGRFGSTQYTPKKPVKLGIKAFTLADANTGYMLNILVYTRAQTLDDADPQFASLPVLAQTCCICFHPTWEKATTYFVTGFTPVYLWHKPWQSNTPTTLAQLSKKKLVFLMPSDCHSPCGTTILCSFVVSDSWSLLGEQNLRRHR